MHVKYRPFPLRLSFITPKVKEEKGKEIATRILAAEAGRGFDLVKMKNKVLSYKNQNAS
jgi:hypothetical protein